MSKGLKDSLSSKAFSGISVGTANLKSFTAQAKKASAALTALGASQGASAGLGTAAASGGAGAVAGTSVGAGAALSARQLKVQGQLAQLAEERAELEAKIASNLGRQNDNAEELAELQRQLKFAEGTAKNTRASAKERAEAVERAKALKKEINRINSSTRGLVGAQERYTTSLNKAEDAAEKINRRLLRTKRLTDGIRKAGRKLSGPGGLLAGAGVGLAGRSAFNAAVEQESLVKRVQILTREFKQLRGLQDAAARSANKFNVAQTAALKSYVDLGNRLGEQNFELSDLVNIYEGLNTVLVANRATTQEAASATLQLNQALGAGILQGQEYQAINEAAPQVISEIARVMQVQRKDVKKLASESKVSAEVIIKALTNLRKKGAGQLEEGFSGAFGELRKFNKALTEFNQAIGRELLPAITPIISKLTELLRLFGRLPGPVKTATVAITGLGVAALIAGPALKGLVTGLAAAAGVSAPKLVAIGASLGAILYPLAKIALAQAEWNYLLNDAPLAEVNKKIKETEEKIKKAEKKTVSWTQQILDFALGVDGASTFVDGLNRKLKELEQRAIDLSPKAIKGFDTLSDEDIALALKMADRMRDARLGKGKGGNTVQDDTQAAQDLLRQLNNQNAVLRTQEGLQTDLLQVEQQRRDFLVQISRLQNISPALRQSLRDAVALNAELSKQKLLIDATVGKTLEQTGSAAQTLLALGEETRLLEAKLAGKEKEVELDIRATQLARELPFLTKEDILAQLKKNQALQEQVDLQEKNKQILDSVVNQTGQQLMGLFDALISGTEDWNKTLQNTLKQLSSILLKAGVSALGGGDKRGLFSILAGDFGGTRANGGPVKAGKPYLVGEKGPELMVPRSSGTVVPNGAGMGSTNVSITVNADGGVQASSQGSQAEEASRLARMIEASTVSIINREKRPGGILSR